MISEKLFKRFYADPKYNGTRAFYSWLREFCAPHYRVLNLGAGPATGSRDRCLKGEVGEVVGADIDPIVLENKELDRAVLIENGRVPLEDASFDLIYSDFVLEHVEKPEEFLSEVRRLLKPGGVYLFRTPNMYHYVTLGSAMTPHVVHKWTANRIRGMTDEAHEPWPTYYRMNSRTRLRTLATKAGFSSVELRMIEPDPSYLKFHALPFLLGVAYERTVNSTHLLQSLRVNILGCFKA